MDTWHLLQVARNGSSFFFSSAEVSFFTKKIVARFSSVLFFYVSLDRKPQNSEKRNEIEER